MAEDRLLAYGGQAVIEGVMMRGRNAYAIGMRTPDGGIRVHTDRLSAIYRSRVARVPFLRGLILLWDALGLGMRALTISANAQAGDEQKIEGPVLYLTLGISLALGIGLFFLLPAALGGVAEHLGSGASLGTLASDALTSAAGVQRRAGGGWLWMGNLVEGMARLVILIGYVWGIGFMPEIRRLYAYHGAEHKTINAFEAGAELTPASVARFPLEHPRCGTAFLLTLVLLSILVFTMLGPLPLAWRLASRVLLIPVLAGIAVEYIRWTARNLGSPVVRWMIRPNLALQRLTTREPEAAMLEVSIAAFSAMRRAEAVAAGSGNLS